MGNSLMATYNRIPIAMTKGEGSYVWGADGAKYLDFCVGIATCSLGHVPPYVKERVEKQLNMLWHCSNLYEIPIQEELADMLTANSCFDKVFFCNSGAEANEGALKLARKYGKEAKGPDCYEVVTFTQSFHGRTMATLAATGQEKIQKGFEPLMPGFRYLPYNDIDALDSVNTAKTCAVLLEVIQGEGGVNTADDQWLKAVETLCRDNGILLMVDEVQTGVGRTGSLFAYQQSGIEPDVMTLAKGLGSGFPIGALLASDKTAAVFGPGTHGSTFGGNLLACSAALATLQFMLETNIPQQAEKLGKYLAESLTGLQARYPQIQEVRGRGLLCGFVIPEQAAAVMEKARGQGVLVLMAGPDVVRILPPLTCTKEEIDHCIRVLDASLAAL